MSTTEEDPELRDLIAKSLENNGVLGKIRAQLRASTFLALDQQEDPKVTIPMRNEAVQKFVSSRQGLLTASLIREFLAFFNMQFTISIFEPESCEGVSYTPLSREKLAGEVGVTSEPDKPILQSLLSQILQFSEERPANSTFVTSKPDGHNFKNGDIGNVDDYDEDFQSSTTSPEPKNAESKAAGETNNEASLVDEEVDVSASDLLMSQGSNLDNDTVDHSLSHSSIGADYAEKL